MSRLNNSNSISSGTDVQKKKFSKEKKQSKMNQADVLIELAQEEEDCFFHDQFKEAYVAIKKRFESANFKATFRGLSTIADLPLL